MPTPEFAASLGRLAGNHLWQSTGFAAVAVLLAFALRANSARARYWLWLSASVKFLVPFSVLAAIGSSLGRWLVPTTPVSRFPSVIEEVVQPFAATKDAVMPTAYVPVSAVTLLPAMLLALWCCGFVAVLLYVWARWRRVAAAVRSSTPLTEGRELEAWGRLAARQPARWLTTQCRSFFVPQLRQTDRGGSGRLCFPPREMRRNLCSCSVLGKTSGIGMTSRPTVQRRGSNKES